ncbi:MAG: hypothetical protein ABI205_03720 [Gemmatimonadaceae bacterium]
MPHPIALLTDEQSPVTCSAQFHVQLSSMTPAFQAKNRAQNRAKNQATSAVTIPWSAHPAESSFPPRTPGNSVHIGNNCLVQRPSY